MATKLTFTNRAVEEIDAPTDQDRLEFKDSRVPGLYLRVTRNGIKSFSFVGRAKGAGRTERATLGRYPAVKVEQARNMAREILGRIASGEGGVSQANRARRGELTLEELWVEYEKDLGVRTKGSDGAELLWRLYVKDHFGKRRLSDVTPAALSRWHKSLPSAIVRAAQERASEREMSRQARAAEKAAMRAQRRRGPDPKPRVTTAPRRINGTRTANQALNLVRAMYAWASKSEVALHSGPNPAAKLDRFKEQSRRRFLQPDELRPFFEALAEEPNETMRDFFLVALLTGARRSNILTMRWKQVHLGRAEWVLDGAETKNKEPQVVTLPPEAVAILQRRWDQRGKAVFVFSSNESKSGHIVEPAAAWRRVLARSGIEDLRVHDLRRTLGSWQLRTGASLALIGKSLNHLSQEATAVYAHLDLDPIRQSVGRATSAMFKAAGIKAGAEVIAMRKNAGVAVKRGPAEAA